MIRKTDFIELNLKTADGRGAPFTTRWLRADTVEQVRLPAAGTEDVRILFEVRLRGEGWFRVERTEGSERLLTAVREAPREQDSV